MRNCGYRILVVRDYLVFYVVAGDEVQVKRIMHGARMYRHLLEEARDD